MGESCARWSRIMQSVSDSVGCGKISCCLLRIQLAKHVLGKERELVERSFVTMVPNCSLLAASQSNPNALGCQSGNMKKARHSVDFLESLDFVIPDPFVC